jgi:hypothetical protein
VDVGLDSWHELTGKVNSEIGTSEFGTVTTRAGQILSRSGDRSNTRQNDAGANGSIVSHTVLTPGQEPVPASVPLQLEEQTVNRIKREDEQWEAPGRGGHRVVADGVPAADRTVWSARLGSLALDY